MLIPSIDLMDGKVVQLRHGKELVLKLDEDPLHLAKQYNRLSPIAVIDLDAALNTGKNNSELIKAMCRIADVRVGGGIRSVKIAEEFLRAGAQHLIIGTAANPEFLQKLPSEKVIVALDHKNGLVVDHGWTQSTEESIISRAIRLAPYCSSFLCTFVDREGCMSGFPLEEGLRLKADLPKPVIVAGGLSSNEEAIKLSKAGIDVQVGMALYTNQLDLQEIFIRSLEFEKQPLIPTIVQDEKAQVLMLAYSSQESLHRALQESKGIYFSRQRNQIWEKGKTSGHRQELLKCRTDCDRDALIFTVRQQEKACHSGQYSCFGTKKFSLSSLFEIIQKRAKERPEGSYTLSLLKDPEFLCKKILEEAYEVVEAKSFSEVRWEIADLLYFLTVFAVQNGIELSDIESELEGRNLL